MDGAARRVGTRDLELRLLGPLEASKRGGTLALGGPKPRALLAILALELGRAVSIDRLVEELWPSEPPDTATHAVQVYVSQLRKKLGAETLPRRGPGYALELDPERVDVTLFVGLVEDGREALAAGSPDGAAGLLREALALWRGPALADFAYEPFAQAEISRLEELRAVALEERIEADLALGRHAELVSELEALVEASPLRERPRAQLMLALYRSGRQADALAAYRSVRELLVEELGVEPGPELKALEAAILRHDESLRLAEDSEPRPAMQHRRLVTILFAGLAGSIGFAERLDPEALGRVQREYFATVSAAIERHGGTIENLAGTDVMAAFGASVAHEDDAFRAARAAMEIRAGVNALSELLEREQDGLTLEPKIGVAASEVVTTTSGGRRRLVAGDAVGISMRLAHSAAAGEIVVGEIVARLVDHAARLEPLPPLAIEGRRKPLQTFRLVEIEPAAPAFERRLDARFAGRRKELGVLRKALRTAIAEERAQVVTVIGAPGIGKSRLAAEIASRAQGVTTLSGRCLPYGDGITYWPLREALAEAPAGEQRDALLALLDADPPPPTPEIALAFRQLCESLARERPLVLVLDDIHWAEPTFLDLLELVTDKGRGPILVLCLAREELLEERPGFLGDQENALQITLDALTVAETEALLGGLGAGGALESDQRSRIIEAAEGNPLFVEQLLALALEGGLSEGQLPETIQALLAARLDRLGPGERAVLERGAVIGKEFRLDDVVGLLEPAAAATVEPNAQMLVGRGFIRPLGRDGGFGFRHLLVQEAVYRATPKRLRAELHERYADHLEERQIVELDEFAGYHLEQAFHLRAELGETGRRIEQLAEDAGRRFGRSGMRAWRRGDASATVSLLGRATELLPSDDTRRLELLCELGLAQRTAGQTENAASSLRAAAERAIEVGDGRVELRARIEQLFIEVYAEPGVASDQLIEVATTAIPAFEALGDHRSLGRAWLLLGWVRGGIRCEYAAWTAAAEQALIHYRLAGSPASTCLGQIAASLYWGPTPVPSAIERCSDLLAQNASDLAGRANLLAYLGGLEAQSGNFDEAWELLAEARGIYEELGQREAASIHCDGIAADLELATGEYLRATQTLTTACEVFERRSLASELAVRAADLAEAVYCLGDLIQAEAWANTSQTTAASDYLGAQVSWRCVRAKVLARRGDLESAEKLARDAVQLAESRDGLNRSGKAYRDLGEILMLAGRPEEAAKAFERAIELYERKGNVVAAARTRQMRDRHVLV